MVNKISTEFELELRRIPGIKGEHQEPENRHQNGTKPERGLEPDEPGKHLYYSAYVYRLRARYLTYQIIRSKKKG